VFRTGWVIEGADESRALVLHNFLEELVSFGAAHARQCRFVSGGK
jgi:hypothetical protein